MGIFGKDRELFKTEYHHNKSYTIHSKNYSFNKNEVTLEENINKRCRIDDLHKIWIKNFLLLYIFPVFIILAGLFIVAMLDYEVDEYFFIFMVTFFIIMTSIYINNLKMKDKLVNDYINRKIQFYNILYNKLSDKYPDITKISTTFQEYINRLPKKYKLNTAFKKIIGNLLFYIIFAILITLSISVPAGLQTDIFDSNGMFLVLISILILLVLIVIVYKYFIINSLKRQNDIWYEISLFEKEITDVIQQAIPDNDKNKKHVNYPVDKTLKQPFAIYFIAGILTGVVFVVWDYQMMMAKQKYLSKAYIVEDYFAKIV